MPRTLPMGKWIKTATCWMDNSLRGVRHPFYASFKVTNRCQFTCSFCNIWKMDKKDLDTEAMVKILRNLGRSSVLLVSFEGGEPLLRKDILQLLQEARRQPFYVMFTTSQKNLVKYPWTEYARYIDFLEISIDEGHDNLKLFHQLKEMCGFGMDVTVQTVVRDEDLVFMEEKVIACVEAGARILLMPAVELENAIHAYPPFIRFEAEVRRLKKKYPASIITPNGYFRRVRMKTGGCQPDNLVINADGTLAYPCRPREDRGIRMDETDLTGYLESPEAKAARKVMASCERQCGWYQYFATPAFSSLRDLPDAISPYIHSFLGLKKVRGVASPPARRPRPAEAA
jgi:MoaA/NifB/PqqE/SkfB family radical SAM enzyme